MQVQQWVRTIRINVCQAQLLYLGSFVNFNRYHIGDYFTNYTSMGLEDLLSNGSLHGPLGTIKTDGQASDPVPVLSCVPQGSVLEPVLFPLMMFRTISGHMVIVFCVRILIHWWIGRFYKVT